MSERIRAAIISLDGDVLDLVACMPDIEVVGLIDADKSAHDSLIPNIGTDEDWPRLSEQDPGMKAILAVDPPALRKRVSEVYAASVITVIAPDARISRTAQIGRGTIVQSGVLISRNVRLGPGCKVNCGAALHHDTKVGEFSTIAPGALLLGNVTVGAGCYVGAGAIIMARRSLGSGSIVGAGAVVTRDVPDGATVAGVPASGFKPRNSW
jgi:sugar O-acyltransferase (sialic acid O-acetyltransferase NeuD family)